MVDSRPETKVVSRDDGSFHIETLYKKYDVEFVGPGGVMGHCPPVGEVIFRLDVTHADYQDLHLWIREHLAETPPNHDGPFVMRDVHLTPRIK